MTNLKSRVERLEQRADPEAGGLAVVFLRGTEAEQAAQLAAAEATIGPDGLLYVFKRAPEGQGWGNREPATED